MLGKNYRLFQLGLVVYTSGYPSQQFFLLVLHCKQAACSPKWHMSAKDVMDKDIFYSVLADWDIQAGFYSTHRKKYSGERLRLQLRSRGGHCRLGPPEPEQPRANSDWWCCCSNCTQMPTERESFCCTGFQCGWLC